MDKELYILDLMPGDEFKNCIFVASQAELKTATNGPFVKLTLSDCSGSKTAKYFQIPEEDSNILLSAKFVCVSGWVSNKAEYSGELTLRSVERIAQPSDLSLYVPAMRGNHKEIINRFSHLLKSVHEPNLQKLLREVYDPATRKAFYEAVAAKSMHHGYRGGLIEHSVEVAELCDCICNVLPCLNRDLLITCALLHDIGKLEEMEHTFGTGAYTSSGSLIGHVFSGAFRINKAAEAINGFPQASMDMVVHLIVSHHGQLIHGAAKEPICADAQVLSQCDLMSARVFEHRQAVESAAEGQITVALKGKETRWAYVGSYGLENAPMLPNTIFPDSMPLDPLLFKEPIASYQTKSVFLPLRGRVAAGAAGASAEIEDGQREVILPPGGADYLLQVTGDSMVNAGIIEGDIVLVKRDTNFKNGDIVVAHIPGDGEVVKTYRKTYQESSLESANPNYSPIPITEGVALQGKVVSVVRDL